MHIILDYVWTKVKKRLTPTHYDCGWGVVYDET
jgi:hypothetical protein